MQRNQLDLMYKHLPPHLPTLLPDQTPHRRSSGTRPSLQPSIQSHDADVAATVACDARTTMHTTTFHYLKVMFRVCSRETQKAKCTAADEALYHSDRFGHGVVIHEGKSDSRESMRHHG